jgi:hypothetical protein
MNGELKEEVYVCQLVGFVVVGQEGRTLRFKKALYRPRQVSRAWNSKLDDTLKNMDFT